MPHTPPRVAILGAGPIGLEAALAAAEGRWPFTVYERADTVAFLLGAKSYGRNSQFLLRIGWQQVEDVFGLLDAQR